MMPPRTILAAVDFSKASRAALRCAARLAAQWRAQLHVAHAIEPLLAAAAQTRHIDLAASTRAELDTFCREAVPTVRAPVLHVVVGSPARAVCDTAHACGADLIVAGTRGLTGVNRLMMGTTVEHIIRQASTSVLAIPAHHGFDDSMPWGPVIAALEDPAGPGAILEAATTLAESLGTPVRQLHVGDPDLIVETLTSAATQEGGTLPVLLMGRALPGHGHAPGSIARRVIAHATAPVWLYLP